MTRLDWATIVDEGAAIVDSYTTPVTLRQLHYRLVAANVGGYENTLGGYKQLSARTARLRRAGVFPRLLDNGRAVNVPYYDDDIRDALRTMADSYALDRTSGQDWQVWVLFEKATLEAQFRTWTSPYGLPIAALRGYSSESLERDVFNRMRHDGRPIAVFYIGDLDPEGEDIDRNFEQHANDAGVYMERWERLAVTLDQVDEYGLVPNPGKATSSRAAGFIDRHGDLFQVETEAIDPSILEQLIVDAVTDDDLFDEDIHAELVEREEAEQERLRRFAETWDDGDAA